MAEDSAKEAREFFHSILDPLEKAAKDHFEVVKEHLRMEMLDTDEHIRLTTIRATLFHCLAILEATREQVDQRLADEEEIMYGG